MGWQGLDFKIKLIVRRDNLDINKFDKYDNINEIDYILNDKSCKLYTLDKETETIIFEFEANPRDTYWVNKKTNIQLINKLPSNFITYLVIYTDYDVLNADWGYIDIIDGDDKKEYNIRHIIKDYSVNIKQIKGHEIIEVGINSKNYIFPNYDDSDDE